MQVVATAESSGVHQADNQTTQPKQPDKDHDGLAFILEDHTRLRAICESYAAAEHPSERLKLARELVKLTSMHASSEERYELRGSLPVTCMLLWLGSHMCSLC